MTLDNWKKEYVMGGGGKKIKIRALSITPFKNGHLVPHLGTSELDICLISHFDLPIHLEVP